MRKVEIVAGCCIALLAIVSVGQWYLDRQPDPSKEKPQTKTVESVQNETTAVTVDEVVETYLPSLKDGTEIGKQVALGSLLDELEGPEYGKSQLSKASASELAQAGIEIVESVSAESSAPDELKARVAGFLAARVRGPVSRDYAIKTLESGSSEERKAVLSAIAGTHTVGGAAIYAKIQEMGQQGAIEGPELPNLLWRTGGAKAVEPITALMKSTDDYKVISACVIALENIGDAAAFGPSLERLEAVGLIDKPKMMPWISAGMFGTFMQTAEGSALSRGIKLMRARPSLVKRALPAIEVALSKGDPETRRGAAEAVKKAVVGKYLDAKRGEELLAGRLTVETEPVLKAELTGGLEQVRGLIGDPKTPEVKPQ